MARKTVGQRIEEIVRNFDISGERILRGKVERRHGAKGFGYYAVVDVAYEGQRINFFRNLNDALEWAQAMNS